MATFVPADPSSSHPLHAQDRIWPETNCYVDLWIEVLAALGCDPLAMLGFTVAQDFEGDQFTFFKPPLDDLRLLYGLEVQELAIFDDIAVHVAEQLDQDRLVLIELDSFHLPDTQGRSYRREHVKTTVGIARIDRERRAMDYFHNAGFFTLANEDYDHVLRQGPAYAGRPELLPPYAEFVKQVKKPLQGTSLLESSMRLFRHHVRRRPVVNPMTRFKERFARHQAELGARPMDYFHRYAFNTLRQAGANAELQASYFAWLGGQGEQGLDEAVNGCRRVAEAAKAMQFQLARAVHRRQASDPTALLLELEAGYRHATDILVVRYA